MNIEKFFQKGYYINLDRRVDRDNLFQEEMKRVGLLDFFQRVSAEDGIIEPDPIKKHAYCAATYYKLFKEIYEKGYDPVLIFEDDAFFYDGWEKSGKEIVEEALDDLQEIPNWDMIYFGGFPGGETINVTKSLWRPNMIYGTQAVGYKRSIIKRVLDEYVPFKDSAIDGWYNCRPEILKYLVNPIAVPQRPSKSDLDANGYIMNVNDFIISYNKIKEENLITR